nr:hypothetical protein [Eubacterium sp.]
MQAQSITLVTSNLVESPSVKTTKANDNTFESFMANHASRVGKDTRMGENRDVKIHDLTNNKDVVKSDKSDLQLNGSKSQDTDRVSIEAGKVGDEPTAVDEKELEEMEAEVVNVIASVLQIPPQEALDLLNQMDVNLEDLATSLLTGEPAQVVGDLAKNIVLNFHGIQDQAALITNENLGQEMTELAENLLVGVEQVKEGKSLNLDASMMDNGKDLETGVEILEDGVEAKIQVSVEEEEKGFEQDSESGEEMN